MKTSGILQALANGPHGDLSLEERRMRRSSIRSLRMQTDHSPGRPRILLLCERNRPDRLSARINRRWHGAIARLFGTALDRRLAAGCPPESRLLLAARAQILVSPAMRLALAHNWTDLLTHAGTPPNPRDPRVPVDREAIMANESEIRRVLDMLTEAKPIDVRGIAMMSALLADGTGPLYTRRASDELHRVLVDVSARIGSVVLFSDAA